MDSTEPAFDAGLEVTTGAFARPQILRKERRAKSKADSTTESIKGGIMVHEEANEDSPLLSRGTSASDEDTGDEQDRRPSWPGSAEFEGLPWNQRPSIFWVLMPFSVMACAFGGTMAPKMNLIIDLICREYISDQQRAFPGLTIAPVDFNDLAGDNGQCSIPEVSARTSMFVLWASVITGTISAVTAPKMGALSDRYGRKPILIVTSLGTIAGEIITIFAALYPQTFPVTLLLLSYALDGLTGSFLVSLSIANAYAADCVPPNMRNVAFGYFHGCLFTGLAIGPILAGYIVKWSGKIVVVFYVLLAVHIAFMLFVGLAVPESLSRARQQVAREKHKAHQALKAMDPGRDWIHWLRSTFNILEPLQILRPRGPGSSRALRRNLLFLATVDTIIFGVAMGSMTVVLVYVRQVFGWQTFESGRFMTIANSTRVFSLLVLLPVLTRLVRGKPDPRKTQNVGADRFELTVLRCAILFDTLGYLGYSLARSGPPFILSGVVASVGGIGSPTLQSALTKHVPSDRVGQLLGATGLLHALSRVVAPAIFNAIFAATVGKFDQAVFVVLCATFGLAFVASWLIRPGVYYDEDKADRGEAEVNEPSEAMSQIPLVSSVVDAFLVTFRFRPPPAHA